MCVERHFSFWRSWFFCCTDPIDAIFFVCRCFFSSFSRNWYPLCPEFVTHVLCCTCDSLLPQLAASLGKALGVLGSHGGQQGTQNICLWGQNGSSGSWCSSPWSPSLFKWRKWDLAMIAIVLRWKVPQHWRQEKQERVLCYAVSEDKVAKTKPVLMGHYAGESFPTDPHPHLKSLWPLV